MKDKSPAFQFYAADFLADSNTLVMSAEEIGIYWLLICVCWKEDGLPEDTKKLSRLARVGEKKFLRAWEDKIKNCFYLDENTKKFRHKRLDKEREKQASNSAKRAKAANDRWGNNGKKSNANALQNDAFQSSSSSSTAIENKHTNARETENDFVEIDLHAAREPDYQFAGIPVIEAEVYDPPFDNSHPIHDRTGANYAYPLKQLFDAFPWLDLTPAQLGMITAAVTEKDAVAWSLTIREYLGNFNPKTDKYNPSKVATVLSVFKGQKRKLEAKQFEVKNGKNQDTRKHSDTAGNKRTNYEISERRDYSDFEGFDPTEVFKA